MPVQTITEARDLTTHATALLEKLARASENLDASFEEQERAWLEVARERVTDHLNQTLESIRAAVHLPELKAERAQRVQSAIQSWVESLRELEGGIVAELGPNHPLLEALFPHRNLDKLRRANAQTDAFRVEFERRRRSTYVKRLSADPDYAFLPALLQAVENAYDEVQRLLDPPAASEEETAALRSTILAHAGELEVVVRQARALAEAALAARPGLWTELGFAAKARRDSARSAAPVTQ